MNYDAERKRLADNQRKMEEATEDVEVGEGGAISQASILRKERSMENQLVEGLVDTGAQFLEVMLDIAESLDGMYRDA